MAINVIVNKDFAHRNGFGVICVAEKKVFLGESGEPSVVVEWSFFPPNGKDLHGCWKMPGETMYSLAKKLNAPLDYSLVVQDLFNQVRASIDAEMGWAA